MAATTSGDAELIALYGRRRVGKTFLVREHFGRDICFELVGLHEATLSSQLRNFAGALGRASKSAAPLAPPRDWVTAFEQLASFLEPLLRRRSKKQVVFLDEVPWLAGRRSGFLPAFEHFWNGWASRQSKLVVVICGSAASWMLRKVVRQRGGLHNRVTRRIRLEPFTLAETEEFASARRAHPGRYQLLELYLAFGGIPHYLKQAEPGESAAQAIDRTCFSRDGLLRDEFSHLYASLFDKSDRHEAVVRALAKARRGLTRNELLGASAMRTGGAATKVLAELEESGFIMRSPQIGRTVKDALYWLADGYSLFYLSWIERRRVATGGWMKKRGTPSWRAWMGLGFEGVCLKHVAGLKHALGIGAVETSESSWSAQGDDEDAGAQIDLVIDRADQSMNLCEMKFSESEFVITKKYAAELAAKRDIFRRASRTKKALFLTLVTTYGVKRNVHSDALGILSLTMDALYESR